MQMLGTWQAAQVDWGLGYRFYCVRAGNTVDLLVLGGDKRKQQADIKQV